MFRGRRNGGFTRPKICQTEFESGHKQPNTIKSHLPLLVWHRVASLPVPGPRRVESLPAPPHVLCTMYKLIRRISSSFFPRPDRPWGEDGALVYWRDRPPTPSPRLSGSACSHKDVSCFLATSTAPQIGRKRRFSSTEPDDEEPSTSAPKRHRLDTIEAEEDASRRDDAEGMKEVTKGVQEVEIEGEKKDVTDASSSEVPIASAAAIPLPESPVLEAQQETADSEVKVAEVEESTEVTVEEKSSAEQDTPSEEVTKASGVQEETETEEDASGTPATEVTLVDASPCRGQRTRGREGRCYCCLPGRLYRGGCCAEEDIREWSSRPLTVRWPHVAALIPRPSIYRSSYILTISPCFPVNDSSCMSFTVLIHHYSPTILYILHHLFAINCFNYSPNPVSLLSFGPF